MLTLTPLELNYFIGNYLAVRDILLLLFSIPDSTCFKLPLNPQPLQEVV